MIKPNRRGKFVPLLSHRNRKFLSRRNVWRGLLATLFLVLAPYAYRRLASPSRRIAIHHNDSAVLQAVEGQNGLQITTYNIAHGRGLSESNWNGESKDNRAKRLREIAKLLREIDADIHLLRMSCVGQRT